MVCNTKSPKAARRTPFGKKAPEPLTLFLSAMLCLLLAFPISAGLRTIFQLIEDDMDGVDGLAGAHGVEVSPDGLFVYVASRLDDAVTVFRRNGQNGELTFVGTLKNGAGAIGLEGAVAVAASPDQRHVYVTSFEDDSLVIFRRNPGQDMLAFADLETNGVGGVFGLDGAADVAVTPDNLHVAVVGTEDDSLALFRRDATQDHLQLVDLEQNGFGFQGASSISIDPLGDFAYITAFDDDAVTVFRRDASLDGFTLVDTVADGLNGLSGVRGAIDIEVSSDGRHAYLASFLDGTLTAFSRAQDTGKLGVIQQIDSGVRGMPPIRGARSVTVTPDGEMVILATRNRLFFFDRGVNGRLRFERSVRVGLGQGLPAMPQDLAASPDGRHLYVPASAIDALFGVYLEPPGPSADQPSDACSEDEPSELGLGRHDDSPAPSTRSDEGGPRGQGRCGHQGGTSRG